MGREPSGWKTRREACEKLINLPSLSVVPGGWPALTPATVCGRFS